MPANLEVQPEIRYVATDSLTLWDRNPRDNEKAVPEVIKSIQKYGFLVPIVVDEFYKVMAGNTRLKAAIKLGMKQVPIVMADHLSAKEIEQFALADNKTHEYATWDLKGVSQLVDLADLPSIPGFQKEDADKVQAFLMREGGIEKKPMAQGSITTMITCPHCQGQFEGKAVKKSEGK